MRKLKEMVGKKYNRLTIIARNGYKYKTVPAWLCRCDCGNYVTVVGNSIWSGHTKSCGCLWTETVIKHGLAKHPLYRIWSNMMERCGYTRTTPKMAMENYVNRGITVCNEWRKFKPFFRWAKNKYCKGLQIDRKDNNGNYEPDNCRFVTRKTNVQNARHSKRWYIKGIKYNSVREAATALQIGQTTIHKWCCGVTRNNKYYPPKKDCCAIKVY